MVELGSNLKDAHEVLVLPVRSSLWPRLPVRIGCFLVADCSSSCKTMVKRYKELSLLPLSPQQPMVRTLSMI